MAVNALRSTRMSRTPGIVEQGPLEKAAQTTCQRVLSK
jgi:hypothetical protein